MISFEYECWDPVGLVEVICENDGTGAILIQKKNDNEIPFERVRTSDRSRIQALIVDWANHYEFMDKQRPENDAFGPNYVRELNNETNRR